MLTIHHLNASQSERIVWLCEELGVPYAIERYARDPVTILSPPALRALHPLCAAPVITDGDLTLAESGAIVAYVIATQGGGRLSVAAGQPGFADYLYWFHFANGNLQPKMGRVMTLRRLDLPADNPVLAAMRERLDHALDLVETRLGAVPFLAGGELTAADIMIVFSLTTMRTFLPFELAPFPNIRAYLQRIGARPAYRRAMQNAEPGMEPMLR